MIQFDMWFWNKNKVFKYEHREGVLPIKEHGDKCGERKEACLENIIFR